MERQVRPQDISWLLDLNKQGQLDLDPSYQRKSVWTRNDREYFIDTILNNYPSPAIFLHKEITRDENVMYHVVDGKQRLQTILKFVNNELKIPANFGNVNLQNKKWEDLNSETKKSFWNYVISVEFLPAVENSLLSSVFERINRNSSKLTAQELRHAKYDGWLIKFAEEEVEKEEWRELGIATAANAKRMKDVQFISELMAVILKSSILDFDQDSLNILYATYEYPLEEVPDFSHEDFYNNFKMLRGFVARFSDSDPVLKKMLKVQANMYSLWSFLYLAHIEEGKVEGIIAKYKTFASEVTSISEKIKAGENADGSSSPAFKYAFYLRGASTDYRPRIERHKALLEYFGLSDENSK